MYAGWVTIPHDVTCANANIPGKYFAGGIHSSHVVKINLIMSRNAKISGL